MDWQRKRHPEDVPTPVAVALADFCRRAKAPASPGLVRDALAVLTDADDFRVRAVTDAEPAARPLGPFAVIDMILGTDATLAAQRQQTGYYDVVREVATRAPLPAPPSPDGADPAPLEAEPPRPSPPPAGPARPARGRKASLKERIAPRKRAAGDEPPRAPPVQSLPGTSFLPRRTLPAPRGRFTTIDPSRASLESLFRPEGKETLSALIAQVPHRIALLRALEQGYVGRRGAALTVGDVEDLLEHHELFAAMDGKEREGVLAGLIDQKGALGRAAHGFGLTFDELKKLISALRLDREVREIRDRFAKEALARGNLGLRLELLFRGKYLEDLRIDRKFTEALRAELGALIDEVKDAATSVPTLVDLLSRQHALHAESLRRALEKLGLLEPWLKPERK